MYIKIILNKIYLIVIYTKEQKMLGVKRQMGRNFGHKTISIGGLGHKREPLNMRPSVMTHMANPEILNTFNNAISHKQPIKAFTKTKF